MIGEKIQSQGSFLGILYGVTPLWYFINWQVDIDGDELIIIMKIYISIYLVPSTE